MSEYTPTDEEVRAWAASGHLYRDRCGFWDAAEFDRWLAAHDAALTLPAPEECVCSYVPDKFWTTHYGAVEPGSQMEPNPDCPVHFPAAPKSEQVSREAITDVLVAHTRINGIYGDCSCCVTVRPGSSFPAHQADAILALFALPVEVEQVKALDPRPWVDRYGAPPVRQHIQDALTDFAPRPEYSQDLADYETGGE